MTAPLSPVARALLGRLVRSQGPWRAWTVAAADLPALNALVAAGLVSLAAGVYRPTTDGQTAITP